MSCCGATLNARRSGAWLVRVRGGLGLGPGLGFGFGFGLGLVSAQEPAVGGPVGSVAAPTSTWLGLGLGLELGLGLGLE